MEAVPRLPMICFDLRISPNDRQPPDFGRLKQYIRDFYQEDGESYAGEIHKLEALRATAARPVSDVTGCAVLKRYYCQLHSLHSRFPMGKDGTAALTFSWKDTYSNMVFSVADIKFEMASILYNIGALHSQLGSNDGRSTSEGLKLACTHFQCAAWAFQHLKDTHSGADLAPNMMTFMYVVCLAQAQECILEKSMTDNRKATINAKVAAQIVEYYKIAHNAISQGTNEEVAVEAVGIKVLKKWQRYTRFKLTYYGCVALLYQGQQSEEQQKMGERMAYYQAAFDKLVEATKLSKKLDHQEMIEEALTFTMDVVEGKRKAAKNENEFIYHEEVPERDALPEIKGAPLVKGIPFSVTDPEISGPDIFARLVPMKAHEASSLYSEEKAKLLRKVGATVDEKDQELLMFTSSLQLDYVNAHLEPDTLPQEIVDRCAALSAKPDAIQNLIESMDKLSDIYHDVEAMLNEIMEFIQAEEVEEREYQEVMGSRPPSIVATDLTREAKKYQEAHLKAAESNKTLHKAMTQHIANLRLLEMPLAQLAQQIPSLKALNLEEQPTVKEMQHVVGKLEEMRSQRAWLSSQLRESVCADDITAQLVTRQGESLDTIFQEELQKHSKYVTLIEANLAAQDNILKALTEAYAQYAPVRKATMEIIKQRNMTLSALMSSYDAYEDLIAKSNKGQEFYRKLETNVTKLLQRVKGTCKVQQEERDTILAKNGKTLPSKAKQSSVPDRVIAPVVPSAGSGGPKLKDYLESYKRDKSGGFTTQNPGNFPSDPYYRSLPSPSPQPVGYSDVNNSAYDSSQSWVPSVRPAPVGQEGTCPATTSQDLKPDPTQSVYSSAYPSFPTNKPYATDGSQYSQPYSEQYASYMSQHKQYPPSSSPYHLPANFAKNDSAAFGKVSNPVNFPPSNPNSNVQAYTSNIPPNYPSPAPSPISQTNYPQPSPSPSIPAQNYQQPTYDSYTVPTTGQQGYNIPTTVQQGYNTPPTVQQGYNVSTTVQQVYSVPTTVQQGYNVSTNIPQGYNVTTTLQQEYNSAATNATQQYYQSYQSHPTQSVDYSSQTGQNIASQPALQQVNPSNSQTPQSQNIPSLQSYPGASASPQHSYSLTNTTSQNPPPETVGSSQASGSSYVQGYSAGYAQASQNQSQQPTYASVDQTISNNFNSFQGKQIDTAASTYSTQATPNYPANIPSQDKSGIYSQYQNFPAGGYSYSNVPTASQGVQNPVAAQPNQAPGYSSYTPQMYMNSDQYSQAKNYTGMPPWQNSYDVKNASYNVANQSVTQVTQFQNTPDNRATFYTQAGQPLSLQTSASTPKSSGQPNSADGTNMPNYTQGNYYTQPYGYQYTMATYETPSPQIYPNQANVQGQVTPLSPMTYMHSSNSAMKLTFSQESTVLQSAANTSSNVDLLAGLDFSVSQDPLVPQQKVSNIDSPAKTPSKAVVSSSSSLDEKLAAVTLSEVAPSQAPLTPVNLTPKRVVEKSSEKFQLKDPFNDPEVLDQFTQEVEKFEKFVEGLTTKTLNGPTPLDIKWKELLELQEKDASSHIISVARCYPMKNRFPDILPYDNSRVELPSTKDDYINASFVKDITPNFPDFIVTQLPLPSTFGDFWTMVLEQQVELVVCLLNDQEMEGSVYWPREKGVEVVMGRVRLTLQSCNICKHWVERIVHVTDSRAGRVVVHLQFTEWPGSLFPSSPGPFLSLVSEALSVRGQQRGGGAVVVHCLAGVGRAGLFLLLAAAVCLLHSAHPLAAPTLPDLTALTARLAHSRKNPLRDPQHFKFAHQALLYYAQDLLMKRGILASRSSFEDKRTKSHTRHPSEDFLLGPPKDVAQPQASPETKPDGENSGEGTEEKPADPLSQLDPLWSLKRQN